MNLCLPQTHHIWARVLGTLSSLECLPHHHTDGLDDDEHHHRHHRLSHFQGDWIPQDISKDPIPLSNDAQEKDEDHDSNVLLM